MHGRRGIKLALLGGLCALVFCGYAAASDLVINEFMASNNKVLTNGLGDTSDWIEIYNQSGVATNLDGWYLTDNAGNLTKWRFPSTNIAAGAYLVVFCDSAYATSVVNGRLYADFSLSSSGEYLALVRPGGSWIEHEYAPKYPAQSSDVSYGIGTSGELRFFTVPTPWAANNSGFQLVDSPEFSRERGFYSNAFSVAITSATAGASIRYTRDGATPSSTNGTVYTGPVLVNSMTCLRAVAYKTGDYRSSPVITHTYIYVGNVITQSLNNTAPGPGWPSSSVNGQVIDYEMDQNVCLHPAYSNLVDDALLAIPTISLVTDLGNLFDPTNGIYVNANVVLMERPTSAELICPDGTVGFQENCGLRIRGGASAGATNPKHAFRLRFRSEYGPSTLKYKIFGKDGPDESNGVDLRCEQFPSFHAYSPAQMNNVRDIFSRDLQLACGQPSTRGDHYHLYLNGIYWGLYQTQENIEQPFLAENWGGKPEDWDVIAVKKYGGEVEGSDAAYRSLWTITMNGFSGAAGLSNYFCAQGLNADGITRNPAYTNLLDVGNLMDFMLGHYWTGEMDGMSGNWGLNNYVCAFSRGNPDGFKFFEYDSEWSLDVGFANNVGPYVMSTNFSAFCAQTIHQKLVENPEYRMAFADRTYLRMFNAGPMVASNAIASVMTRVSAITNAIIAESARWGDQLVEPPMTRSNWLAAVKVTTNWMAGRTPIVIGQLRSAGWYPGIDPPAFFINGAAWNGGPITNGSVLTMTASNSISYTLNGTDPRAMGGGNAGLTYGGPISLPNSVLVKARALNVVGGSNVWSALQEAVYTLDIQSPLRITEVMYHPRSPTGWETNSYGSSDYEFIEFRNTGNSAIGLAGLLLSDGVEFDFARGSVSSLGAGEYVLVVDNLYAFTNRYANWGSMKIAGEWNGELDNGGERIRLVDRLGRTNAVFTYSDGRGWPLAADGAGHSLVPLAFDAQTNGVLDYGGSWRASAYRDGSPGRADPAPVRDVVLNELMAHTDYTNGAPWQDSNDWIELFNAASNGIAFTTNWYLSDDQDNLKKWAIPSTNIAAAGWLTFFEVGGFHPATNSGFGLNKGGEQVYLSCLPGTTNDRVADCVSFKGQENYRTWGRYGDGGDYWYTTLPTTNAANLLATQAVVISEIMYHPPTNAANPVENSTDEFIELYNPGAAPVTLTNEVGAYRLDGEASFVFASNTTLAAGGYLLVVSFDPETNAAARAGFLGAYGLEEGQVNLVGPYSGKLSNRGGRVAVERPLLPDVPDDPGMFWVIVDEVIYFDQWPWPDNADGTGFSLVRLLGSLSGNDFANWMGSLPTPGLSPGKVTLMGPYSGSSLFTPVTAKFTAVIDSAQVTGSVERVEFWEGTNLMHTVAGSSPPYEYIWSKDTIGTYQIRARMIDAGGAVTNDSQTNSISVLALENAGASNVTELAADLYGRLSGGGQAEASICWGTSDAGTNRWGWETVAPVGSVSAGLFSVPAGNIMTPVIYCRAYARAGGNEGWAPSTASLAMRSYTTWSQHLAITVGAYTNSETLYSFPLLVTLGTNISGFTYGAFGTNWYSLRFTDEQGRRLPYEVQSWNTNGSSYLWVGVAALTNRAIVHAWWGNAAATSAPAYTQDGSVWTPGYDGVWHLEAGLAESSGLSQPAADYGSTGLAGAVLQGRRFDGTNAYVDPRVGPAWYESNRDHLTVSFWVKPDSRIAGQSDRATAFGSETLNYDPDGSPSNRCLYVRMNTSVNSEKWYMGVHDADKALSTAKYSTTQWQLITLVLSNGTAYGSMNDGARVAITNYSDMVLGATPVLGKRGGGTNWFRGTIDEFRLARVARSAAWTQAECGTLTNALQYGSVGPASVNPDANGNGLPDAWEQGYFGTNVVSAEGDWDLDGMSNTNEYTAGTDPTNPASYFAVDVTNAGGQMLVQFLARSAQGAGYEGCQRFYDLLSASGLVSSVWWIIPGYSNLPGNDAVHTYTNVPEPGASALFFQGRTRLQ